MTTHIEHTVTRTLPEGSDPLADEIRQRVADGETMIYQVVSGIDAVFFACKVGPRYLAEMTDDDVRRVVVY